MLSQDVEKIIEAAVKEAKQRRHEFATVEHLCLVLFEHSTIMTLLQQIGVSKQELKARFLEFIDNQIEPLPKNAQVETLPSLGFQRVLQRAAVHIVGAGKEEVGAEHVLVAAFDEDESYAVFMMQQSGITRLDLVSVISHGLDSEEEELDEDNDEDSEEEGPKLKKNALAKFTYCLTEAARKGLLDQVIGRESEIERAIQVLSRRRKNNPLLVGEPGVGKTALAEGLANRIVKGLVPAHLKDAELYLLDMGAILAGARYRGDFESRMKALLKSMEAKPKAIIVIDEIHTVIGAGSTTGSSMDASNLMKPILAKGQLRCIGSTTYREYRSYFEKDRALARRFQKIDIEEPNDSECIEILKGIKDKYEEFHGVKIDDEALTLAVTLSKRFLHERRLPDKAIDLVDEACARVRLKKASSSGKTKNKQVDAFAIEEAVASMAHVPSQRINRDEKELLRELENKLRQNVFGQEQAISEVCDAILMSRAGLRDKEKPVGCFLFTGPSGVGKTEVARQLAEALAVNLIRFDMSEYMERHAVSRLVGAPPGYVGFDQGGLLTDAVDKNPYAVLLLDEIEKAHPDVFNMLLQVMDYGKLTDSNGRVADFRHIVLIMTSNVGARERDALTIGFMGESAAQNDEKAIKKLFSPEFRNRLDAKIAFEKLKPEVVVKVVEKFIRDLQNQLLEKNISIVLSEEAALLLAKQGYDPTMGARPLARIIQEKIKKPLAHAMLFGQLSDGGCVKVDVINDEISMSFAP